MKYYIHIFVLFVVIYTACFVYKYWPNIGLLPSNELGDFLAGLFAPIAFYYLYHSFKQQGDAIKTSNDNVIAQLEIQRAMMEAQQAERLEREFAAKPSLKFSASISNRLVEYQNDRFEYTNSPDTFLLSMSFLNEGAKITHVCISCIKPENQPIVYGDVIDENQKYEFKYFLKNDLFLDISKEISDIDIEITYRTALGIAYRSVFEINLPCGVNSNEIRYSLTALDHKIDLI